MFLTFILFSTLIALVFGQARVLHTQSNNMSERQVLRTSIIVNIGWLLVLLTFIYLGLKYSWGSAFISLIIGITLGPTIFVVLPFFYIVTPLWPVIILILCYLEFFS